MAWKCLRTTGSRVGLSSLSSSTGSESAPGALQFAIARTAFCVFAYVGSASSDIGSPICDLASGGGGGGAFLRCCTFSTMDGRSAGDLVLSRLPTNLSHRRRMSPLSCRRLPFSSLMACCPSVFLPPRPAVIFRRLYRPLVSRCRRSVSSSARYSSKWTSTPLSIAARTSLHAARSDFHVAVVCLVLHCRRASRFLSSAAKSAALTAGRSLHPSLRGVRLASGKTACAAPRMASVNFLASSATLARWPAISSMLSTNFRITRSRRNLLFSWLLSNGRGCGVCRTRRLWAYRPPRSTVANTMLWSESALIGRFGCGYTSTLCTLDALEVDALEVASAIPDDTVVSVRDAAFSRAEECVRDSKFVVCGEVQQAFTVVVQLITSICTKYPTILRSLSFYLLAGTCVRANQHKKTLLFWDMLLLHTHFPGVVQEAAPAYQTSPRAFDNNAERLCGSPDHPYALSNLNALPR